MKWPLRKRWAVVYCWRHQLWRELWFPLSRHWTYEGARKALADEVTSLINSGNIYAIVNLDTGETWLEVAQIGTRDKLAWPYPGPRHELPRSIKDTLQEAA